jgi:hypothetical protein
MVARQVLSLKLVVRFDRPHPFLYDERTDFQKTFIRVLLVVCLLSVFSVSVFASGTSTTPAYPSSTYTYVRGVTSTGSVSTGSATYFDAVTDSLVGIGGILGSMWTKLETIRINTGYLSSIATDTDNLSTIKTYVNSGNTWLSKIYSDVSSIKTSLSTGSGSSAWTSNQASSVTSNSTLIETNTRNISNKVATEATLKTLATESTVSSIKSILAGFKSNLDTITTKVSDLADVLASPEDKQLHDNSKSNLDYVNGDSFSSNISDTSKFDTANDASNSFSELFSSSDSVGISGALSESVGAGNIFWSQKMYNMIHYGTGSRNSSFSTYSIDDDTLLPYDPYEQFEYMRSRFPSRG